MMELSTKKSFVKMYKKLTTKEKKKVADSLKLFAVDPFDKNLRNHAVSPKFLGCRSINS